MNTSKLQEIFKSVDVNKDGRISPDEIKNALHKLKLPNDEAAIAKFMHGADSDKDGSLSFEEFSKFVSQRESSLRQLFSEIDADKNGRLSLDEVKNVFSRLNIDTSTHTDDDWKRLMKRIDFCGGR